MSETYDQLRAAPAFDGVSDETLTRLADVATEAEFPAGHVLIEYDTPAAGLYLILEGRVAVHAPGAQLERGPGEVIGERALAIGGTRGGRVSALTDVRCLGIAREHVDEDLAAQLLEQYPEA
ncbi:MAG TPA: cyclic nucleotide-binding domain-containing protein [Gaiellaceae bacterium]|nr:cyclic nucleotide-binding domain-containing protein [Gaiellaceae bacterium]